MPGEDTIEGVPNNYCVGGIIGSLQAMDKVIINNVKVLGKDIDRKASNAEERNKIVSKHGNIGGAFGLQLNNYDVEMRNIVIKNYDIINKVDANRFNIDQTQAAGFCGVEQSKKEIKNIKILQLKILMLKETKLLIQQDLLHTQMYMKMI